MYVQQLVYPFMPGAAKRHLAYIEIPSEFSIYWRIVGREYTTITFPSYILRILALFFSKVL